MADIYNVEDVLLEASARDVPWQQRGACVEIGGDLWFPDGKVEGGESEAKGICRDLCPVREECLETALKNRERWGIWGGLGPRQRQDLLSRMRKER